MKLDDRPVIDQLLNPTPLNHLRDVHAALVERTLNREAGFRVSVEGARQDLTSAQVQAVLDVLELFMGEMESRL